MTRENEIGHCRCPVCGHKRAALRFSGKKLAYVTCDSCNVQIFARSSNSDEKLRALHIMDLPDLPKPEPSPSPPEPKPAPSFGWGMLRG